MIYVDDEYPWIKELLRIIIGTLLLHGSKDQMILSSDMLLTQINRAPKARAKIFWHIVKCRIILLHSPARITVSCTPASADTSTHQQREAAKRMERHTGVKQQLLSGTPPREIEKGRDEREIQITAGAYYYIRRIIRFVCQSLPNCTWVRACTMQRKDGCLIFVS